MDQSTELLYSTIFVELDTILDTRMSTLFAMSPKTLEKALLNGYHGRLQDVFPNIDHDEFKTRYENRDKSLLMNSIVTPISAMVKEFVVKTHDNVNNSPHHYKPKVILNVYPYKLQPAEIAIMTQVMAELTLGMSDIEVVDMSYEQISPLYVKHNLSIMVLYRYDLWLDIHSANEKFKKTTCPDVTLFGPKMYFKHNDHPDPGDEAFESMRVLAGPFVNLILLPLSNFSSVTKITNTA